MIMRSSGSPMAHRYPADRSGNLDE
jgi:hypothetical protein